MFKLIFSFQMFFEGIEEKIKMGIKAEEISYQLAYSKQEFHKVAALYPSREVSVFWERILTYANEITNESR